MHSLDDEIVFKLIVGPNEKVVARETKHITEFFDHSGAVIRKEIRNSSGVVILESAFQNDELHSIGRMPAWIQRTSSGEIVCLRWYYEGKLHRYQTPNRLNDNPAEPRPAEILIHPRSRIVKTFQYLFGQRIEKDKSTSLSLAEAPKEQNRLRPKLEVRSPERKK